MNLWIYMHYVKRNSLVIPVIFRTCLYQMNMSAMSESKHWTCRVSYFMRGRCVA